MIEPSCPRAGKWIGGCRFEARYDLSPARALGEYEGPAGGLVAIAETTRAKTYIHDICTRCGRTVEPRITNEAHPAPSLGGEGREG